MKKLIGKSGEFGESEREGWGLGGCEREGRAQLMEVECVSLPMSKLVETPACNKCRAGPAYKGVIIATSLMKR